VPADAGTPPARDADSTSDAPPRRAHEPGGAGDAQAPGWAADERNAFSAAVDRALPAVLQFAPATGREAAVAAADVLSALADAMESIPDPKGRVREQLVEVRFEAKRLRRSDRMPFSLPKWIKLGSPPPSTAWRR
jgi:hypothetical protein